MWTNPNYFCLHSTHYILSFSNWLANVSWNEFKMGSSNDAFLLTKFTTSIVLTLISHCSCFLSYGKKKTSVLLFIDSYLTKNTIQDLPPTRSFPWFIAIGPSHPYQIENYESTWETHMWFLLRKKMLRGNFIFHIVLICPFFPSQ